MNPITTVTTASWSYDLTDLATLKDEISVTTSASDSWLSRAITQVSKAIAHYCNRVFQPEAVSDTFYLRHRRGVAHQILSGDDTLQLSRWPIISMTSVSETDEDGTLTAMVQNTDYKIDAIRGQLIRLDSDSGLPMRWKGAEIAAAYVAGYGTAVSEAHTVPANPGPYTVTVAEAAAFSIDMGVTGATSGYTVAGSTGIYTFLAADAGKPVTINYATSAIPADLTDAVLRELTGRVSARGRDPMLMERTQAAGAQGSERFWVPTRDGAFAPEISAILDTYRVPVIG